MKKKRRGEEINGRNQEEEGEEGTTRSQAELFWTLPQLPPLGGDLLARRRGGLQKKKMREEKER